MLKVLLVIATFAVVAVYADDRPLVDTSNGQIRGGFKTSRKGRRYVAFEGIPYAKPPVGELRFKEPQPQQPWTGILDAQNPRSCSQHACDFTQTVTGTEDCLYLNVYTPEITAGKKYDVFVYIHGGAFMCGSGTFFSADFLLDRDVVVVMMNYRLGALGFLSTEDDVVPGNNAMKDQLLAMKWAKENIHQFGGNPDSITLAGESAGSVAVHYHLLSPLSRGLFHRAISASGTALVNWGLAENSLQKVRQIGVAVGCDQVATQDLVQCLRQRPVEEIHEASIQFQPYTSSPFAPFAPTVEFAGDNKFLPDNPYNILKQGHVADVPWLTSVTSDEGLYPTGMVYNALPELEARWTELAPHILHYNFTVPPALHADVAQKIKEYYLKGEPISKETFLPLAQAVGDRSFVVDGEKAARLQAQVNKSPVYFFRFNYRGEHSYTDMFTGTTEKFGVCHGDDAIYFTPAIYSWTQPGYPATDEDNQMIELYLDMWTSFAQTGIPKVPSVTFLPVSPSPEDQFLYLNIASPSDLEMRQTEALGHNHFWNSLPFQENDLISTDRD